MLEYMAIEEECLGMRYHNSGNYFIADMVELDQVETGKDNTVFIPYILQYTSNSILELMRQYPMAMQEEEIFRLMAIREKFSKNMGAPLGYCYSYFGNKNGLYQGISIVKSNLDYLTIQITTNNYIKFPSYQRRVSLNYDLEEEGFMVDRIVELERVEGKIVQNSFSPRVLKKTKKFIHY